MSSQWPALPPYESWRETCDTLHAHTQVLGKLAVALAPPEPQLQHAALRLTARGWETPPLPAPDGSGVLVAALDLRAHEAVVEHSDGGERRIRLTPDRPVGEVARAVLGAVADLGRPGLRLQPDAPGGVVDRAARRGRRARPLRRRSGRHLLRRRDPGRARAGGVPRALSRALDAGQRVVGLIRPRREPVLGRLRRAALGRLHHAQRHGLAGGGRRLVARRRPLRLGGLLRLRAPGPGGVRRRDAVARPRRTGTGRSASTSSTGTTSARPTIRTRSPWTSPARPSATRARCAAGTPRSRPASRGRRRPSSDGPPGARARGERGCVPEGQPPACASCCATRGQLTTFHHASR